jgi:ribonuclease HII
MAGPVCAAAVILPDDFDITLLDDSKKLSEKRREIAMREIYQKALYWCVAWASAAEIDEINILNASLLAMKRAWEGVASGFPADASPVEVIVDGLYCPDIPVPDMHAFPRADGNYPAVMAASILAKTARDRMMMRYDWLYPEYGYARHKGYPTPEHIKALKINGPSPIQRMTFRLKGEGQLALFDDDRSRKGDLAGTVSPS